MTSLFERIFGGHASPRTDDVWEPWTGLEDFGVKESRFMVRGVEIGNAHLSISSKNGHIVIKGDIASVTINGHRLSDKSLETVRKVEK